MAGKHTNRKWWIIDLTTITITDIETGVSREENAFAAKLLTEADPSNPKPTNENKHRCVRAVDPISAVLKFQARLAAAENVPLAVAA